MGVAVAQTPPRPNLVERFSSRYVLPGGPPVTLDLDNTFYGVANSYARNRNLQGRVLWVDGTANLDKVADDAKVASVVRDAVETGFNVLVFDVKPISGQVLYKSKIAPKIESWRGRNLPKEYDPLPAMVRETKAANMQLVVSLNAFSEGHNLFKAGPGYEKELLQTVIYDSRPALRITGERDFRRYLWLNPKLNVMPTDELKVSVFSEPNRIVNPDPGLFAVALNSLNVVVDGFEDGGTGGGVPALPRGGCVLVGRGQAADWLRTNAIPGRTMEFSDVPYFVPISTRPELQFPLMMNPHHPMVIQYCKDIVAELMDDFGVTGFIYDDRLRYAGMYADFSPAARNAFEGYIGRPVEWPNDIFRFTYNNRMERGLRPGRYYDAWMAWRSWTMRSFVKTMSDFVHKRNKNAVFAVYAGSWYGEYPQYGTNIAGDSVESGFWFANHAYRQGGFASDLDFLVTGCYYPIATIFEAMTKAVPIGRSVESAGQLSNQIAGDRTWVYAGISLDQFKNNPDGLHAALSAAAASTQGVMVFDYSHDFGASKEVFRRAFGVPRVAPHQKPGALADVQKVKREMMKRGYRDRPVIINAGSAGVGF